MGSGSNKVSARVYPWHDLGWDLALADGMVPAQIETRFAANNLEGIDNCDMQAREAASIQDDINTDISTHLWRDILEGKVPVRKANGNPLKGESKQFKRRGPDTPHLTVAEGNEWLTKNRYLQVWAPGDLKNPNVVPVQRAVAQDAAILCEIKKQGYDRLALPNNQPGKNGVKRAVRDALKGDPLFIGTTVFDKAWERLSHDRAIVLQ